MSSDTKARSTSSTCRGRSSVDRRRVAAAPSTPAGMACRQDDRFLRLAHPFSAIRFPFPVHSLCRAPWARYDHSGIGPKELRPHVETASPQAAEQFVEAGRGAVRAGRRPWSPRENTPIPGIRNFTLPLLTTAADGQEHTVTEAKDVLARQMNINQTATLSPSGTQARF